MFIEAKIVKYNPIEYKKIWIILSSNHYFFNLLYIFNCFSLFYIAY